MITAECRDRLAASNMRLVAWVVKQHFPHVLGTDAYDDVLQEGAVALLRAAEYFDPSRGVKFSTYATRAIWGQVARFLQAEGRRPMTLPFGPESEPADGRPGPGEGVDADLPGRVEAALARLPERHRHVIQARFWGGKTLAEAGAELRVTRERARQLEALGLAELRGVDPGLEEFLGG